MDSLDLELLKEAWLDLNEINWIQRWLENIKNWEIYNENEFYSNLEKRLFSKKEIYV